jgi:8-oxo-dGTP pyrophosphatase MutT (NUDIX family)
MSTTAIVTEILIVGMQTIVVLAVALMVVAGGGTLGEAIDGWRRSVPDWKDVVPLLIGFTLAAAYTVGIVVDRLADVVDDTVLKLLRQAPAGPVRRRRMQVMHKSSEITKFLEYQRSRLRIARATYVNIAVFIVLVAAVAMSGNARPDMPLGWILVGSVVALAATVYVFLRSNGTFVDSLATATAVVQNDDSMARIAAAVCYRLEGAEPRFLLVQTKAGKWTFPKGHVKRDESAHEAAAREAREEAGAQGSVAREPFTTYLYPKQNGPTVSIDLVHAYLQETTKQSEPDEDWRHPAWCNPAEAKEKLAHDQQDWYATQMGGVLALALVRLQHPDSASRTHPAATNPKK